MYPEPQWGQVMNTVKHNNVIASFNNKRLFDAIANT